MPSVNQTIRDETVAHAIGLGRYFEGIVSRMISLLNEADFDLMVALAQALPPMGLATSRNDDLERRLTQVRQVNAAAYRAVLNALRVDIRRVVEYEVEYHFALFSHAIPADVLARYPLANVSVDEVYAGALTSQFQGATLNSWVEGAEHNRLMMMRTVIRTGYGEGKTPDEILREIQGVADKRTHGKLEGSRQGLAAIIRTVLLMAAALARSAFYAANSAVIIAEQWISVLDTRTSVMCRVRDGKLYTPGDHRPIGHSVPWLWGPGRLHFCCRSTSTAIIKGYGRLGLSTDQIGGGSRASMDGQVPADTTYLEWLAGQSTARQDEVLGRRRGRLYREGGLPLEEMYTREGYYLTLDQLRTRDAAPFRRLGL